MPSVYSRRRFSEAKAKELFKIALEKRPKSIHSLKQSLLISTLKYERFATTVNQSIEIFRTSYTQPDSNKEGELTDFTKVMARRKEKGFFQEPRQKQHKNMDNQLPQQRISTEAYDREENRSASEVLKIKRPLSMIEAKNRVLALRFTAAQKTPPPPSLPRSNIHENQLSMDSCSRLEGPDKFWRKTMAGRTSSYRPRVKTETDEKVGESALGDLTQFSHKKQSRAIKFLILQLQANVKETKRTRTSAGLPP